MTKQQLDEVEKINLRFEINGYKLSQSLGVWMDEDKVREQRRRLWMLKIIQNKEDEAFLKRMGLQKI